MIDVAQELRESLKRRRARGELVEIPRLPYHHKRLYPNSRPERKLPALSQAGDRPKRGRRAPCDTCGREMETKKPEGERKCMPCRIAEGTPERVVPCDGCGREVRTRKPEGEAVRCVKCRHTQMRSAA